MEPRVQSANPFAPNSSRKVMRSRSVILPRLGIWSGSQNNRAASGSENQQENRLLFEQEATEITEESQHSEISASSVTSCSKNFFHLNLRPPVQKNIG